MLKESVVNAFFRYEFYDEQTNTILINKFDINIWFLISINILICADFNEYGFVYFVFNRTSAYLWL